MTVFGHLYVDAATIQLTLEDGSTLSLPIIERFFLGSLAKEAKVTELTAYDTVGQQVAQQSATASGFEWRQP